MGQKTNPVGLRLGITQTWDSRWFANKGAYGDLLIEDMLIRKFVHKELKQAQVTKVIIERPYKKCRVIIHTARPGVVIGKKGGDVDRIRSAVSKLTDSEVHVTIVDIRQPETDAKLVAVNIARQLERRVGFRRAMKRAVQLAVRFGVVGIRVDCAGRLGGAEIARTEWMREGRVPLHTLRSDIDYGLATAHTTYGACGVKVWICKGEIMVHDPMASEEIAAARRGGGRSGSRLNPRNLGPES